MAKLRIEILTHEQLVGRTAIEPSNADLFAEKVVNGRKLLRLQFMHNRYVRNETYIVLYLGQRIVGAAGIAVDFCDHSKLCLNHVSVELGYRRSGFAQVMLEAMYLRAVENGQHVSVNVFTELGQHLKPIFNELDRKYPQASSGLAMAKRSVPNAEMPCK